MKTRPSFIALLNVSTEEAFGQWRSEVFKGNPLVTAPGQYVKPECAQSRYRDAIQLWIMKVYGVALPLSFDASEIAFVM
jgi:hypothetical protein